MRGKAFKYGDHINTDLIIPARHLTRSDEETLRAHCMEDLDADFPARVQKGDFIVAGRNFGCGSSREHAPIAIKASGVACVIAENFARIFFRNAINIGLPVLECEEAAKAVGDGDELEVDLQGGVIENLTRGVTYTAQPFPEFMERIIALGGLVNYVKSQGAGEI